MEVSLANAFLLSVVFFALFILLGTKVVNAASPKSLPLPPAPKGLPLVGNYFDLPKAHRSRYFEKLHAELDSPIVRLSVMGKNLIDISDFDITRELLGRRQHINSSRDSSLYFEKYINHVDRHWAMGPRNATHKLARRLTEKVMAMVRRGNTEKLQTMEARCTLKALVDIHEKEDQYAWSDELSRYAVSIVSSATYGFRCESLEEPKLKTHLDITDQFLEKFWSFSVIDFLPILDKIPGPLPWRTADADFRKRDREFYNKIGSDAVDSDVKTWAKQFFLSNDQEDCGGTLKSKNRGEKIDLASELLAAANGTTGGLLMTFMLAWTLQPEAFQSAAIQLQEVVGEDRLPEFADRECLPLVDAIIKEMMRWRPMAPNGIPHMAGEDQTIKFPDPKTGVVKELFIPKGSILAMNQWCIDSDSKRWEQPNKVSLERWINHDGKLKSDYQPYAFGWGYRICPGRPLAERSLFIMAASLLWGFNPPEKVVDPKTGKIFAYNDDFHSFTEGVVHCPLPFPIRLSPRSQKHAELIGKAWDDQEKDLHVLMNEFDWID